MVDIVGWYTKHKSTGSKLKGRAKHLIDLYNEDTVTLGGIVTHNTDGAIVHNDREAKRQRDAALAEIKREDRLVYDQEALYKRRGSWNPRGL